MAAEVYQLRASSGPAVLAVPPGPHASSPPSSTPRTPTFCRLSSAALCVARLSRERCTSASSCPSSFSSSISVVAVPVWFVLLSFCFSSPSSSSIRADPPFHIYATNISRLALLASMLPPFITPVLRRCVPESESGFIAREGTTHSASRRPQTRRPLPL